VCLPFGRQLQATGLAMSQPGDARVHYPDPPRGTHRRFDAQEPEEPDARRLHEDVRSSAYPPPRRPIGRVSPIQNQWTRQLEELASQIIDRTGHEAWIYGEMVTNAKGWADRLTIASGIITGLISLEGIANISAEENPALWLRTVVFILSLVATVLLAVNNTWKPAEVSADALSAQVKMLSIQRVTTLQLALHPSQRPPGDEYMKTVLDDYAAAMLGAPVAYPKIVRRAEARSGIDLNEVRLRLPRHTRASGFRRSLERAEPDSTPSDLQRRKTVADRADTYMQFRRQGPLGEPYFRSDRMSREWSGVDGAELSALVASPPREAPAPAEEDEDPSALEDEVPSSPHVHFSQRAVDLDAASAVTVIEHADRSSNEAVSARGALDSALQRQPRIHLSEARDATLTSVAGADDARYMTLTSEADLLPWRTTELSLPPVMDLEIPPLDSRWEDLNQGLTRDEIAMALRNIDPRVAFS
jgi:hypothetical protein